LLNKEGKPSHGKKIMTVLDSKSTKSVGHFEENKFSVGGHQFLLECCPKLIKTYKFGQNAVKKSQFKNKMNNIVQLVCLCSKLLRLFVHSTSAIVVIFYHVNKQFLDITSNSKMLKCIAGAFSITCSMAC
jgi:hypothetical protein